MHPAPGETNLQESESEDDEKENIRYGRCVAHAEELKSTPVYVLDKAYGSRSWSSLGEDGSDVEDLERENY